MEIILASASPRRREILENLGVKFTVRITDTDESSDIRSPEKLCCLLSRRKAETIAQKLSADDINNSVIIGCDTVVALENEIFGKPKTKDDACRMLRSLSGKTHRVISGLTVIKGGEVSTDFEVTEVAFDKLTEAQISAYISREYVLDKAGAYAVQGLAACFISKINGSYFNVVGLPVHLLYKMCPEIIEGENNVSRIL